ncbi:MAG: hypothetical protein QF486_03515 [Candidatus Woesearchaeota archaeon]|jgi:hypothetical protein|nr:hypothetical protein [Candidatus Woesearchaeota archaeon]MDP7182062.1 hypothetical protein [Candidatus Woesearchaeota archaeon]MDP7198664.1 hypothetical protein [Candidatus Woesearchaeota archaeon]MDP7467638.1 hypothetical protein [Candidatus Woesearchaeota archaeon]MDP7647144.1 hypothetical protein [Candidatus Woesearchaeota archaeon]|tara:strand:+ start:504 stop:899 length:396 start_codon:yes stop_codon:yes gene_type:complete
MKNEEWQRKVTAANNLVGKDNDACLVLVEELDRQKEEKFHRFLTVVKLYAELENWAKVEALLDRYYNERVIGTGTSVLRLASALDQYKETVGTVLKRARARSNFCIEELDAAEEIRSTIERRLGRFFPRFF